MISVSFYEKFEIFQDIIEKALLQQKKFLECLRFSLGMDAPNTCVYVLWQNKYPKYLSTWVP